MREYKWIIVQGEGQNEFRCGLVNRHKDLVQKGGNVFGGGLFCVFDNEIDLYDESSDFGWANESAVEGCKEGIVKGLCEFYKAAVVDDVDPRKCRIVWKDCMWDKHILQEKS